LTKVKVVLVQLGSPLKPTAKALRVYLKEFLGDPRVVDLNPLFWKIILNLFVLPFRPRKSAQAYARIWDGDGFPLVKITQSFARKVASYLPERIECEDAFLLSSPTPKERLAVWDAEDVNDRAQTLYVIPQFPQFAEATVASGFDKLAHTLEKQVNFPHIHFVSNYHLLKSFIDLSAKKINQYIKENDIKEFILSFHGVQKRRISEKKDLYYKHCFETFYLIRERLELDSEHVHLCFQSRFGTEDWLGPYTDKYAVELAQKTEGNIGIYSPSFVVDCLETTDELGHELGEDVAEVGGTLIHVPCLNDDDDWAKDYAHYIKTLVDGSRSELEDLFYTPDPQVIQKEIPYIKPVDKMSDESKRSLKLMFMTLFIDLVGFSLIFPLFPAMAKYYWEVDKDNVLLQNLFNFIYWLGGEPNTFKSIVLFGGILGAIYSLLQFFAAPFWGSLSDRIGRRPVLLISLIGIFFSYLLWILSGSFTLLLVSRVFAGFMAGNLSTASAVVSDITTDSQRSRGMAVIGIAFALGFILGPAIGGISSMWDPTLTFPLLKNYGVNPFSFTALIGALLAFSNLLLMTKYFKETLKNKNSSQKTANLFKIFKPLPIPNVNKINIGYFIFITAFSGMEFTLTFLAVERFNYTPWQNAQLFIFIGFVIALVQGGYVRRKSHQVGEKKMVVRGLTLVIPGLIFVALASKVWMLYLGLFFLSIGSAMSIPNMTALVSLLSPKDLQGKSLGIFRSLGSLSRVIGPLGACVIYWRIGSTGPYYISSAGVMLALIVIAWVKMLPKSEVVEPS
jgi:ferrochelatase